MTTECPLLIGIFDGFSWIRCEGTGSFLNSPALKEFGIGRIEAGESCLVVDLGGCTGMDSTFMGTLAGMASRLSATGKGVVQIADPGARNRRSLEDLGLDFLMEVDPPEAVWHDDIETIRARLHPPRTDDKPEAIQQALHVLEAHQTLAETNDKNARTFSNVVTMLENEVAKKQELADKQKNR